MSIYDYLDQNLYVIKGAVATNPDGTSTVAVSAAANSVTGAADTSSSSDAGMLVSPEGIESGEVDGNLSFVGGFIQSKNFVHSAAGWRISADGTAEFGSGYFRGDITGATGTFSGTVNVGSLNIPDSTTASSFHVDTSGNAWWGANVATGYAGANAYILATGAAVFKNVQIGGSTIQYVITNSGIFSFGDGSDGSATISVNTSLTRDMYYDDLTVNAGVTLKPSGYRIFVKGTFTLNGTVSGSGDSGTTGQDGFFQSGQTSAAAASAPLADGYLKGSSVPGDGGKGSAYNSNNATAPGNGTNATNSLGSSGAAGGIGGNSAGGLGFPSGPSSGGVATATNVKLIANWHLATLLDISSTGASVKFNNSGSAGGGGGGGSGGGGQDGGGGGGGSGATAGRPIAIYARVMVISATGAIVSNGGNGGAGGAGGGGGASTHGGGGGGGGGAGNGGWIVLVYNTLTNSGSLTVNAGTAGAGGPGGVGGLGTGATGATAAAASPGVIYQFQLSL